MKSLNHPCSLTANTMVLGWRRAFCTSISKDREESSITKDKSDPIPSPRPSSRFAGLFSNPSTPRLQPQPVPGHTLRCRTTNTPPEAPPMVAVPISSAPQSPKLQCKTRDSPRFFHRSTPSSPRSPSTFSLLKSSLRLTKSRCGICLQSVKTGDGSAIFTAECGHSFHFPCITSHVKKQGSLTCPICNSSWKEMHLLNADHLQKFYQGQKRGETVATDFSNSKNEKRCTLKVYNDDEPLSSPTSGSRFNPIPESDETEEENEEFPGFFIANDVNIPGEIKIRNVEVALSPEVAVISVQKTSETYALVLKIKAPPAPARRTPVDLVTVLNVSRSLTAEKLYQMKRAMRLVVSALSPADRLSIVAFSTTSKRLLPLRRMTTAGKKSARRIIDAIISLDYAATSASDSLKKAAKVIEDRREKNPAVGILLFTDGHRSDPLASSSRLSLMEIPIHSISLSACVNGPPDDTFARCINGLLSAAIHDLKIQLGSTPGSSSAEIKAVYSFTGRPACVGSGSSWCRVGDFHSEEEKELLIELKVPSSFHGSHRLLFVQCSYKDPSTHQPLYDKERTLFIPRPRASRSSTREIQRLKSLFVSTRAVAESRRLVGRNDIAGAHHMLASARALVLKSGEEFVPGLEAELSELNWKWQEKQTRQRRTAQLEEKVEALTPTSAWKAAERLAKVAIMRKSLNRVSDLHGFEDARF